MKAYAHVYDVNDAHGLVDAGIDVLAHSVRDAEVDVELVSKIKNHDVIYIPTLSREQSLFVYAEKPSWLDDTFFGNSGFVVGEHGFGPAPPLDTVDAPILKPSAFGRGWDLGTSVHGGAKGRAGDAPLLPKWLITMGLRQKNRFNECKECGCEPANNRTCPDLVFSCRFG